MANLANRLKTIAPALQRLARQQSCGDVEAARSRLYQAWSARLHAYLRARHRGEARPPQTLYDSELEDRETVVRYNAQFPSRSGAEKSLTVLAENEWR